MEGLADAAEVVGGTAAGEGVEVEFEDEWDAELRLGAMFAVGVATWMSLLRILNVVVFEVLSVNFRD